MSKILLDTSILIDHLRVKGKNQTIFYKLFESKATLFISILTHTECYAGKGVWENRTERDYLKNVLSGITILSLEENTSEKAGEIRAKYGLTLADAIIAATALSNKLPLATLNIKDFEKVKNLKILP
jgi:predicted nucleic acid-binding protein